ncbi:MAG TPA: hypothetical protein VKU88_06645 [Acidimicrobiales bacterium]|nr:hypothetical protein [Acidimicrobiales bacterium]
MLKRIRWLTTGLALGFGASFWLRRKAREAADRYRPAGLAAATAARARDALAEGRIAMREREAELRGERAR